MGRPLEVRVGETTGPTISLARRFVLAMFQLEIHLKSEIKSHILERMNFTLKRILFPSRE